LNVCLYLAVDNATNQRFPFVMQEGRTSATGESSETKSHHSDDEYEGGLC
jgi:hypothetical protein